MSAFTDTPGLAGRSSCNVAVTDDHFDRTATIEQRSYLSAGATRLCCAAGAGQHMFSDQCRREQASMTSTCRKLAVIMEKKKLEQDLDLFVAYSRVESSRGV